MAFPTANRTWYGVSHERALDEPCGGGQVNADTVFLACAAEHEPRTSDMRAGASEPASLIDTSSLNQNEGASNRRRKSDGGGLCVDFRRECQSEPS